ncbi:MAG: peptide deformylase [Acidobacteriota bacterium]
MSPLPVRLVGDPVLRERAVEITDFRTDDHARECAALMATLEDFRARQGFGRAIAAPQVGCSRRMIALNLGEGPFVICNPVIVQRSERRFTMWDDCMSFPWLLVRVERHESVSVEYFTEDGQPRCWDDLDRATSELLQHEIDHLDGVLALDRAVGDDPIVAREAFEADPERHARRVDYLIEAATGDGR